MLIGLSFGLAGDNGSAREATAATILNMNDFPRDLTIFDSGAARGANLAQIPVSGTTDAVDGAVIELRAVHAETGAQITAWQAAASAIAGQWSASLSIPRQAEWMHIEARLAGSAVSVATANRFGVGHIVGIMGQSEDQYIFGPSLSDPALSYASGITSEQVQFITVDDGADPNTRLHTVLLTGTEGTRGMSHLAAAWCANTTDKLLVVDLAHSGTGRNGLANDSDTSRSWDVFAQTVGDIRAWGADIGLLAESWHANDMGWGSNFPQTSLPFYAGIESDSSDYSLGTPAQSGLVWDHVLWDLSTDGTRGFFDPSVTKLLLTGPHRYEISQDMLSAIYTGSGALDNDKQNNQRIRQGVRAMVADPLLAPIVIPAQGPEMIAYEHGYDQGGGNWADYIHPSKKSDDGTPARARHWVHSMLFGLGLVGEETIPQFDQWEWASDGSYVEVWSSAGPVTTTRLARGEPAIPASYPHRTEVAGFEINGLPAQNTSIVGGRVRILPNAAPFSYADALHYGLGGGTGEIAFPDDKYDRIWKNLPVMDVGISGVPLVAIRPLVQIPNELPAPDSFTVTRPNSWFLDPALIGAGITGLSFQARGAITDITANYLQQLLSVSGNQFQFGVLNSGALWGIVAGHGTYQSSSGLIASGVTYDFDMQLDLTAGTLTIQVDGTEVLNIALSGQISEFPASRSLVFLSNSTGGSEQMGGTFERLEIWTNATGSGVAHKTISGTAAAVNSDPWLQGDPVS